MRILQRHSPRDRSAGDRAASRDWCECLEGVVHASLEISQARVLLAAGESDEDLRGTTMRRALEERGWAEALHREAGAFLARGPRAVRPLAVRPSARRMRRALLAGDPILLERALAVDVRRLAHGCRRLLRRLDTPESVRRLLAQRVADLDDLETGRLPPSRAG